MSDPAKELAILQRFQTLIRAAPSLSDDQVLVMPGAGQGSEHGVWLYPGDTQKISETTRNIRLPFGVNAVVIVSDETRDLAATLMGTAATVVKQIMAERDVHLSLSYVIDVEPVGAGVPLTEDPGLLASAMRAINWDVVYQTTNAELTA